MLPRKKTSQSLLVAVACMVGVAITLLGINFWHVTQCKDARPDETEELLAVLTKRLVESDAQVLSRTVDEGPSGIF